MADSVEQLDLFPRSNPMPDYTIRESARARHVSIKITLQGGVEIVTPKGFDLQKVPEIVQRRQDWICKTLHQLRRQTDDLAPEHFEPRPSCLALRSQQQTWQVIYQPSRGSVSLSQSAPQTLTLRGDTDNLPLCAERLRHWLTRRARAQFAPWLRELSFDIDLPFNRVSIRGQKTRWASCSSQRNISLNYKLLFLPPELVQYVFVHELCHTIHMNHSRQFWQLVEEKMPDYAHWRHQLRDGWQYVPRWVESHS